MDHATEARGQGAQTGNRKDLIVSKWHMEGVNVIVSPSGSLIGRHAEDPPEKYTACHVGKKVMHS